jgi:transcriptional regulator with XRE-family HTH domain
MSIEAQFGKLVRDARVNLGWSQRKLAQKMQQLGFRSPQSTIAKNEHAARPIPIQEALTLTGLLQVDVSKLAALIPVIKLEPECPVCHDNPPAGFTCNECGQRG